MAPQSRAGGGNQRGNAPSCGDVLETGAELRESGGLGKRLRAALRRKWCERFLQKIIAQLFGKDGSVCSALTAGFACNPTWSDCTRAASW